MAVRAAVARHAMRLVLGPLFYLRRAPATAALLLLLVLVLTAVTQVGGAVLWLLLPALDVVARRLPGPRGGRLLAAVGLFLVLYLMVSLAIVPPLAAPFGRVPLPCGGGTDAAYNSFTSVTCLLNRHYATPVARDTLGRVAARLDSAAPGRRISYLDAGFPFFAWFPMLPHLSHGDGRKVDLALPFRDPGTGRPDPGEARSPVGYWGYVRPVPGAPLPCRGQASWLRWDFDRLQPLMPELPLDVAGLKALLGELAADPQVRRLLLEPHIAARLGIEHPKVRFQGCAAARHDDHIHVEFR